MQAAAAAVVGAEGLLSVAKAAAAQAVRVTHLLFQQMEFQTLAVVVVELVAVAKLLKVVQE